MNSFFSIDSLLLLCIVLSALLLFLYNKASSNSFILLIQSSMIACYLFISKKISTINIGATLLLIVFCLMTITVNIYIEKSVKPIKKSPPKTNIITAVLTLLFFTINHPTINNINREIANIKYSFFTQDFSALIFTVFTFFTILVSSFLIFNIKNTD